MQTCSRCPGMRAPVGHLWARSSFTSVFTGQIEFRISSTHHGAMREFCSSISDFFLGAALVTAFILEPTSRREAILAGASWEGVISGLLTRNSRGRIGS